MDKVEKLIRDKAIYSPNDYKEVDTDFLLQNLDIERKYMGQLSRVYRINGEKWMIKEARWDLSMEFVGDLQMPLPVRITEKILKFFSFTFLPRKDEIVRQYKLYLEFAQYFGYFKDDKTYYHPNRDLIFVAQRNIRNSLAFFRPEIEKYYKFKIDSKIDEILHGDIRYHNFLPKEYLLVGKSISPENQGKPTSLIFQEFIEGTVLYEYPDNKMNKGQKQALILMIYLILLMHMQIKILPDTRPRYHVLQAYNWLTKTDNVMVTKDSLVFIDTRFFWNSQDNYIKRGVIIPDLVIQKAKSSLNHLLAEL